MVVTCGRWASTARTPASSPSAACGCRSRTCSATRRRRVRPPHAAAPGGAPDPGPRRGGDNRDDRRADDRAHKGRRTAFGEPIFTFQNNRFTCAIRRSCAATDSLVYPQPSTTGRTPARIAHGPDILTTGNIVIADLRSPSTMPGETKPDQRCAIMQDRSASIGQRTPPAQGKTCTTARPVRITLVSAYGCYEEFFITPKCSGSWSPSPTTTP